MNIKILKKFLIIFVTTLFLSFAAICGTFFYFLHHHVIDFAPFAHYNPGKPTILLDDQGNEWARFSYDKRELITIDQIPSSVINAFLAAEDWQFFHHRGISWRGILRSTLVNLFRGKIVQGASTITQQLVKLLFFNSQKTLSRKIKEQVYAILIEQQFTKEYILQTYLNHIYLGCGIYGIQAAAQRFWGVDIAHISIAQAATLASIVRSPEHYNPILAPQIAEQRRNITLHSMYKLHYITSEQYQEALKAPLAIKMADHDIVAPHFKEAIRVFLENNFGKEALYSGGLIVQTTLNKNIQKAAQESFKNTVAQLRFNLNKPIDGGLLSLDVKTGAIKALVGGYDYQTSKFNRAFQSKRQMGSIFKPLIYTIAIMQGKSFADIDVDEPLDIMQHNALWQPNNYNNKFEGPMTLAQAIIRSNNIIAIKQLLEIGYDPVIDLAYKTHLPQPIHAYPSLALGCVDAAVKEVAGMFNIFANGGIYCEPHFISWVKNNVGTKIYKTEITSQQIVDSIIIGQVSKVLEYGIGKMRKVFKSELVDSDVVCKTGTTNDFRTCWFAGSTPEITSIVYIGCDDNSSMGENVFPLRTAFVIWKDLHGKIPTQTKHFSYDPRLKEYSINGKTGYRTYAQDPHAVKIMMPT